MSIIIYSKKNCPKCEQAKMLCNKNNISYEEKDIIEHLEHIRSVAVKPVQEAPQVFYNNKHIGGFQDFVKFFNENKEKL